MQSLFDLSHHPFYTQTCSETHLADLVVTEVKPTLPGPMTCERTAARPPRLQRVEMIELRMKKKDPLKLTFFCTFFIYLKKKKDCMN